jgi:L-rhamnose isomerase / sugar isomerase
MNNHKKQYHLLSETLLGKGVNLEAVKSALKRQKIETPSWGYGNSGTRFKVFPYPGAARDIKEKLQDAALVHKLTGIAPSVALHIPWDKTKNWKALADYAKSLGLKIGAINPNVFQEEDYKFGSITNRQSKVRKKALGHILDCIDIMKLTGSKDLSLWFADGTNYPGQANMSERKELLEQSLKLIYKALPDKKRMLVEYKFFEPAFYHTDIPDWGTSYALCLKLGPKAQVLVDTGHHAPGTNIEQIVAILLSERRLGGFHFNSRKYADDDLIVGSQNPFELFLIFVELILAGNKAADVAYMIDQSHNIEPKIEAMLQSVINCQSALAKALLVNLNSLKLKQKENDVLGAYRELLEAFETDVRPLLAQVRVEMGVPTDPLSELKNCGYEKRISKERGTQNGALEGYPG